MVPGIVPADAAVMELRVCTSSMSSAGPGQNSSQTGTSLSHSVPVALRRSWQRADTLRTLAEWKNIQGLPWWLRGKEPACQCRRRGFSPWSERIPHTLEQRSLCTTTIELGSCNCWTHVLHLLKPTRPGAHAPHQEKPLPWETHAPRLENSPHS